MSELDILRRREYKANRKKWMTIQIVAIILLAAIALGSFLIYNRMNRTYYIEYTEKGTIDYKVQYKENEFFDKVWIDKDQTYISSLIEGITADFGYRLNTDSSELGFSYQYKIDAKMVIASKDTGVPYYTYEENIFPPKETPAETSSNVKITETVSIDYVKYNEMAKSFVKTYGLENTASCTLIVTLDVEILTSNKQFDKENKNRYTTSMNIPLVKDSFGIFASSSSPDGEVKVLEYQSIADRDMFRTVAFGSAAADALLLLILFIFINLTRNEDVTYAAKINKILRSYGSFIQRMEGEFEDEGYQIINIKTFIELLGIRDTIQSPVLMSENHDETMTRFLIPTNTKILYIFEIKVDNYDEIYSHVPAPAPAPAPLADEDAEDDGFDETVTEETTAEPVEEVAEEPTEEAVEEVAEEPTEEAVEEPTPEVVEEAVEEAAEEAETVIIEDTPIEEVILEPVEEIAEEPTPEEVSETVEEVPEVTEEVTEEAEEPELIIIPVIPEEERAATVASAISGVSGKGHEEDLSTLLVTPDGRHILVKYRKSFRARIIQADEETKTYYSDLKNYLLSFEGITASDSFNYESFGFGRKQVAKINISGKTVLLFLAINPAELEGTKYKYDFVGDKARFEKTPIRTKIRTPRSLKWAKELIDLAMLRGGYSFVDERTENYVVPFESRDALIARDLIEVTAKDLETGAKVSLEELVYLIENGAVIEGVEALFLAGAIKEAAEEEAEPEVVAEVAVEPEPEVEPEVAVEPEPEIEIPEPLVILEEIDEEVLAEAMTQPDIELSEIAYTPDNDEVLEPAPEEEGVEVIGVVWPEREKRNKVYRYDPNGEVLEKGDIVLVPTHDAAKGRDVVRKVAVAHENHKVAPEHIKHPLKKVIAIVKKNS